MAAVEMENLEKFARRQRQNRPARFIFQQRNEKDANGREVFVGITNGRDESSGILSLGVRQFQSYGAISTRSSQAADRTNT